MLDKKDYKERVDALQRKLLSIIRSVVRDADVDGIHDMRTTLRRLQLCVGLLPKSGGRSRYLDSLKELSKVSRELRDIDVISLRLDAYPGVDLAGVKSRLSSVRLEAMAELRKELASFGRNGKPIRAEGRKLDTVGEAHRKAVRSAERKLDRLLPLVSFEGADIDNLHAYRKTGRKLRYLLELTGDKSRTRRLTDLQDRLGELRDIDLTLDYISQCEETPGIRRIAKKEETRRNYLLKIVTHTAKGVRGREGQKDY